MASHTSPASPLLTHTPHPLLFCLVLRDGNASSPFGAAHLKSCPVAPHRAVFPGTVLASQLFPGAGVPGSLGSRCGSDCSPWSRDRFCLLSPSCHGKAEECIGLCRALLSALHWLLRCTAASAERLQEGLEAGAPAAGEKQLAMCLQRLEKTLGSTKNRALLHIAKLEEACMSLVPPEPHLPLLPCPVL